MEWTRRNKIITVALVIAIAGSGGILVLLTMTNAPSGQYFPGKPGATGAPASPSHLTCMLTAMISSKDSKYQITLSWPQANDTGVTYTIFRGFTWPSVSNPWTSANIIQSGIKPSMMIDTVTMPSGSNTVYYEVSADNAAGESGFVNPTAMIL